MTADNHESDAYGKWQFLPENADSIRSLIDDARTGSEVAQDEMMRSLNGYLLLVADQELDLHLRAKVGASDIVQQTLHLAQQNLPDFRGQTREALLAWARTILLNEINAVRRAFVDTEKRQMRRESCSLNDSRQRMALLDTHATPSTEASMHEDAMLLRRSLQQLSPDHRMVIVLRNWERLPFDQIGAKMNRSADAAKKLWARALGQLKELLDGEST